jgi:hypothetical protein
MPPEGRTLFKRHLLVGLNAACLSGASPGLAQSPCRPADAGAARVAQDLRRAVVGSAPHRIEQREAQHLPGGPEVQLEFVADAAVCRAALESYEAVTRSYDRVTGQWSPPPRQLYLLRVGTVYVAWAPERGAGEFGLLVTLDREYRALANVMH